jgi:hypothetical protein
VAERSVTRDRGSVFVFGTFARPEAEYNSSKHERKLSLADPRTFTGEDPDAQISCKTLESQAGLSCRTLERTLEYDPHRRQKRYSIRKEEEELVLFLEHTVAGT